jgi:hypothetical protein
MFRNIADHVCAMKSAVKDGSRPGAWFEISSILSQQPVPASGNSDANAGGSGNERGEDSVFETAGFSRSRDVSLAALERRRIQGIDLHSSGSDAAEIQAKGKIVFHVLVQNDDGSLSA